MKRFLLILSVIGILVLIPLYFLEAGSLTSIRLSDYRFRNVVVEDLTVNGTLTTSGSATTTGNQIITGTLDVTGQATFTGVTSTGGLQAGATSTLSGIDNQDNNIINIGNIAVDTISADDGSSLSVSDAINFSATNTSAINVVWTPSATLSAGTTTSIVITNAIMRVKSDGNVITVTSTPSVADGDDGQIVILQGDSDTDTLTLQDESNLGGSGLALSGGNDMTLGKGDTLTLIFDAGDDKYYEISRSDN